MKKILIIAAVIFAVLVGIYLYRKNAGVKTEIDNAAPPPVTPPPVVAPGQSSKMYFIDAGEGLAAIQQRALQLAKAGEYNKQAAKLNSGVIFEGVVSPIWAALMGGVSRVSWPLSDRQNLALKDAANLQPSGDWKAYMQALQRTNLAFLDAGLPAFLTEEAKGGGEKNFFKNFVCEHYSGCPGTFLTAKQHNQAKDTAGNAMFADLNTVAKNILSTQAGLDAAVNEKALADLRASGWKFVGFDAPA